MRGKVAGWGLRGNTRDQHLARDGSAPSWWMESFTHQATGALCIAIDAPRQADRSSIQ